MTTYACKHELSMSGLRRRKTFTFPIVHVSCLVLSGYSGSRSLMRRHTTDCCKQRAAGDEPEENLPIQGREVMT